MNQTREEFIQKYCFTPAGDDAYIDSSTVFRKELDELLKQEAIGFVEGLRDYEREGGTSLLDDERQHDRTTEELYELYKDNQSNK